MPKIPWTPPERKPRIPIVKVPAPDTLCPQCKGAGRMGRDSSESNCWVCKGTGMRLPAPEPNDDPFAAPPWPTPG